LLPIYDDIIDQPNIDPIYELNEYKNKIINPVDLTKIISSKIESLDNQKKIINNIKSYFTEFDHNELTKIRV